MSDDADTHDAGPDRRVVLTTIASLGAGLVVARVLSNTAIPVSAGARALDGRAVFRIVQGVPDPARPADLFLDAGELLDPFTLARQLEGLGPVLIDADVDPANEVLLVECVRMLGGGMPASRGDLAGQVVPVLALYT